MKRDDTMLIVVACLILFVLLSGGMMGFGGYGMMGGLGGTGWVFGGLMGFFIMALTVVVLVLIIIWFANHMKQ